MAERPSANRRTSEYKLLTRSANEPYQPNQEYYLEQFGQMSFAAMICPENEKDVLDALQRSFYEGRHARLPQR